MNAEEVIFRFRPYSIIFKPSEANLRNKSPSANAEFVEMARLSGLYDYETQGERGREAGKEASLLFLSRDDAKSHIAWTETQLNLYRTPASGERRYWIPKMDRLVIPGESVAVGFSAGESSVAVNLSRIRDPMELCKAIDGRFKTHLASGGEEPIKQGHVDSPEVEVTRAVSVVQRIIRDTALTLRLKEIHDFKCQICGIELVRADGSPYAEGAHIWSLKDGGPDTLNNMLCLCPNDHIKLDTGAIFINEDLEVIDRLTRNKVAEVASRKGHLVDAGCCQRQRSIFDE